MQNEPLRRRLVELHSIYLTPSPSDEMAREVGPPVFVFLPGVEAHVSTEVEVIVKPNRGRKFYRHHTFTIDPDRVSAAVEAIGTDVVLDLVVVDAEIVAHIGTVPVWR